jgi:hypothetical protein
MSSLPQRISLCCAFCIHALPSRDPHFDIVPACPNQPVQASHKQPTCIIRRADVHDPAFRVVATHPHVLLGNGI